MINLKEDVVTALRQLIPNVYFFNPPIEAKFPCICYYEVDNRPNGYADNEELITNIQFQIDIFSRESTSELAIKVNKVMKGLGFARSLSRDLADPDPFLFHKTMRFEANKIN